MVVLHFFVAQGGMYRWKAFTWSEVIVDVTTRRHILEIRIVNDAVQPGTFELVRDEGIIVPRAADGLRWAMKVRDGDEEKIEGDRGAWDEFEVFLLMESLC